MNTKAMKPGWMLFSEYCESRGIKKNGSNRRKLSKLSDRHKENLTPSSKVPTWAVNTEATDKHFNVTNDIEFNALKEALEGRR